MSDEWVIENLRVTLFSAKHKERVIIQNNRDDLRVTSRESEESIRHDAGGKAAADRKAKKEASEPAAGPTAAPAAAPAAPTAAPAAAPAAVSAPAAAAPPSSSQAAPAPPVNGSLKWHPTVDAGYDGFAAKSRDGDFVVLKTERSLWALYFSWGPGAHVGLGCFRELKDARAAAQEQHDKGPVTRPNGKITPEMVNKACPAPETAPPPPAAPPQPEPPAAPASAEPAAPSGETPRQAPRRTRTKRADKEAEPARAPEPTPASESPTTEAIEIDPDDAKRMMGQLKDLLNQES